MRLSAWNARRLMRTFVSVVSVGIVVGVSVGLASPAWASTVDTLYAGQSLQANQQLTSGNGSYRAVMQSDGNFVVYGPTGAAGWNIAVGGASYITLQTDGNLVAYTAAGASFTWESQTYTSRNDYLVIQNDGNLVIYSGNGIALWANGSIIQSGATLAENQQLTAGEEIDSPGGLYRATMQSDGNFVEYGPSGAVWSSNGASTTATHIVMQGDGNLVAYNAVGSYTWASGTAGNPGAHLSMQDDGNLVIYAASGAALWAHGTSLGGSNSGDDYPFKGQPSNAISPLGYNFDNCTDFVAWRMHRDSGNAAAPWTGAYRGLGDAATWAQRWPGTEGNSPRPGAVAFFSSQGHVAYVDSSTATTVTIEEYNWNGSLKYDIRVVAISGVTKFLYR